MRQEVAGIYRQNMEKRHPKVSRRFQVENIEINDYDAMSPRSRFASQDFNDRPTQHVVELTPRTRGKSETETSALGTRPRLLSLLKGISWREKVGLRRPTGTRTTRHFPLSPLDVYFGRVYHATQQRALSMDEGSHLRNDGNERSSTNEHIRKRLKENDSTDGEVWGMSISYIVKDRIATLRARFVIQ